MEERFWADESLVFLRTPGSIDTITLRQAATGEATGLSGSGVDHIGFRLQPGVNLDDAVQEVVSAGGKVVELGEHEPGDRFAYVSDPDGYVIEL